jgi:hypothetical protein
VTATEHDSTLAWSCVELDWAGQSVCPADASHDGDVILLFGDFHWLFAHLIGEARLVSGTVRCLGHDGRAASISGRVGVSPAGLQRPPQWTVSRWLELNVRLLGGPARRASASAGQTLERLGLQALAGRHVHELNGAESFAAHAAFAACTEPELVLLAAPLLLPETREYELGVLRALARHCRVAVACQRRDEALWQLASAYAYCADRPGARTTLPTELLERSQRYRVRPLGPGAALASALAERGASIEGPTEELPWTVSVPSRGAQVITEAAQAAEVALAELVSVPEAR